MKGLQPLFLGIFGIFGFSWLGLTVVPNLQIGSLNPQSDEEGTDIYPQPLSGMAARGARVYAANGCFYCHSQQVRPEYGGADIERKWGDRRSAPRDYIFEPIVFLGKMRNGPDLANVGHRSGLPESAAAPTAASPSPTPATAAAAPPSPAPAGSASPAPQGDPAGSSSPTPVASPGGSASPAGTSAEAKPAGSPAALSPTGKEPAAKVATSAPVLVENVAALTSSGTPIPYSAAWHHRHLYNPRSVVLDSNMPSYRFLYEKQRIGGEVAPDAINFAGASGSESETGWQIVPSYDAKCLVAYLMSRDQSHPLKEAKSAVITASTPAPAQEAKK